MPTGSSWVESTINAGVALLRPPSTLCCADAVWGHRIVLCVASLVLTMMRRAAHPAEEDGDPREVADRQIPLRLFGQGVMYIVTGGDDYGYYPPNAPQKMLGNSWSITDSATAHETIRGKLNSTDPDGSQGLAFDLVTTVFLARSAAGAGYITHDESWDYTRRAAQRMQSQFADWAPMAELYAREVDRWKTDNDVPLDGKVRASIAKLAAHHWPRIPFKTPV